MKILSKVKMAAAALAVVVLGSGLAVQPAFAANNIICADGSTKAKYTECKENKDKNMTSDLMGTLNIIINVALGLIGFVAVVMIIMGGVQYTTSAGDTGKVTKAKNTIMYGIIGLVIALLAYAIVNFVLGNVFGNAS